MQRNDPYGLAGHAGDARNSIVVLCLHGPRAPLLAVVRRPQRSTRFGRTTLSVNKVPRPKNNDAVPNLGLGAQSRRAADTLRNSMDASDYRHVIFAPIVRNHISDAFEELRARA